MTPTITICTDASYRKFHKYKYGVWACYIRTPERTVKTGGLLKEEVNGSTDAERLGLANALVIADSIADLSKHRLIIYCDNMAALSTRRKITYTPKSSHYAKQKATKEWFDEYVNKYLDKAVGYEMRHVKGHLEREQWSTTSKRNYMNNWVDVHARNLLRTAIKERMDELRAAKKARDAQNG